MAAHSVSLATSSTALPVTAPTAGRLICLGKRQSWAQRAIKTDTLRFGVPSEPHDLCFRGDWDGVTASLVRSGKVKGKATELMGQLRAFYTFGPETLWITRVEKHLWWGFAEPKVIDQRGDDDTMGVVTRHIRGGWSRLSMKGSELLLSELKPRFKVLRSPNPFCRLDELADIFHVITDA